MTRECLICQKRFKKRDDDSPYCREHRKAVALADRDAKDRRKANYNAFRFAHYKGHVVGFYPNGEEGTYKPQYVGMSLSGIPKYKLIDLDRYAPGFDRRQIRKLKACVMSLACMP